MPSGAEDDPIVRGNRDYAPEKYQCGVCQRWFIEPWQDVYMRSLKICTTWNGSYCDDCVTVELERQWREVVKRNRSAWDRILGQ